MSSLLSLLVIAVVGAAVPALGTRPLQELVLSRQLDQIDLGQEPLAEVVYGLERDHQRMTALIQEIQTPIKLAPIWTQARARMTRQQSRGSPRSSPLGSPIKAGAEHDPFDEYLPESLNDDIARLHV